MTDEANREALRRIAAVTPVLTGTARAGDVLRLAEGELGHAGPPFTHPDEIPPVVLNALAGAVLHEGWAGTAAEAERLIRDGRVRLRPNHDLGTVSPMAGVVRPSQIVMCVADANGTGTTFATLAEAGRRVLRFGVYGPDVAAGLRWLDEELGPAMARALPRDGLPILPLIADGIRLGDDVHQRNVGGMLAFARALPNLDGPVRSWLLGNPQAFLNTAMAAAKLALDAADGVAGSTIVTAISRNGAACGIRMAGTGRRWFTAPASLPEGGLFPPHTPDDVQPDLGDSAIVEAFGLGGTIAHASPELAGTMGRAWDEARQAGMRMRALFSDQHPAFSAVLLGQAGAGLGLDAARVVASRTPVRIHTGIAHRDGRTGWIGIGVAQAPLACFQAATRGLLDTGSNNGTQDH